MTQELRRSPAFPKNRDPILASLRDALGDGARVLEVGSGPGEHAAWFAGQMPGVTWTPSDVPARAQWSAAWVAHAALPNLLAPRALDLAAPDWGIDGEYDALVAINVMHASWPGAPAALFGHAARALAPGGVVFVYGPYRYADRPLEPSNAAFDARLKARDPGFGVPDFEAVDALARAAGFALEVDRAVPSNNRAIWWRKGLDVG
jgi:SAM-dependent methyltransferase